MLVSSTSPKAAQQRSGAGLSYLVVAGVLWGTSGLLGTLLGRAAGVAPAAVAGYRLVIGGALIVAVVLLARLPLPRTRAAWSRILLLGLLAAVYQGSYFTAVSLTSVSLATLVTIGMSPVLVVTVTWLRNRDGGAGQLRVLCLALTGLGLLVGFPAEQISPLAGLAGTALALLAAAGFAATTMLGARPVPELDDRVALGFAFLGGGLLLAVVAAVTTGLSFPWRVETVGLLAALGAGPTAVAYALYFRGLRTVSAGTAVVMALLEPLTGALLAAVFLGDRLGPVGTAGAVLLAVAVLSAGRAAARARRSHRPPAAAQPAAR